jgi:hypothetical protein
MNGSFAFELSVDLPVPPAAAWEVIADYGRDADWRHGVAMRHDPPGTVVDGTITHEDLAFLGSIHHTQARIDGVEPGRAFRFTSADGRIHGHRRIEPRAGGCALTVGLRVEGLHPLGAAIAGWLYRRRVRGDLARLRALLGAAQRAAPVPA